MKRDILFCDREILSDEIEDKEFLEFAIVNLNELLPYIESARTSIRIHRDITGRPDEPCGG